MSKLSIILATKKGKEIVISMFLIWDWIILTEFLIFCVIYYWPDYNWTDEYDGYISILLQWQTNKEDTQNDLMFTCGVCASEEEKFILKWYNYPGGFYQESMRCEYDTGDEI